MFSEDLLEFARGFFCGLGFFSEDPCWDFSTEVPAEADHALVVVSNGFPGGSGECFFGSVVTCGVVVPCLRDDMDEIFIAFEIFCEEDQLVVGFGITRCGGEGLDLDGEAVDGFDPGFGCTVLQFECAAHSEVVG